MTGDNAHYEADEFLKKHRDIQSIDLLIPDTNGVFRGKRIVRDELLKVYQKGVYFPCSVFAQDITGNVVEETGLGLDCGEADMICRPVAGSLKPILWKNPSLGQLLLTMKTLEDKPFYGEPRNVLRRVLQKLSDLQLVPVVAIELEFYLLDPERTPEGFPQPPISPVTGAREKDAQVYSIDNLDDYQDFLRDVAQACQAQGIPASTAVAESAPGQFEVNLLHQSDPLQACDQALFLKQVIKGIARKKGMEATFMAKPYIDQAGNGTHVHISLLDEQGNNVFQGEPELGSDRLQHAIGGLLTSMEEAMVVFAPTVNSYKRFQKGSYAPLYINWGWNNRTTSVRIPASSPEATRIEHRVAGADANPYLLMAILLAGIHHGLENQIKPFNYVTGNAYEQVGTNLPNHWHAAREAFEQGKIVNAYFGQDYCKLFTICKSIEMEAFNGYVSTREYDWFLRTV